MEPINHQELKDYVAIAQTEDLNELALTYATIKEWTLLEIVTEELTRREYKDRKQTIRITNDIRPPNEDELPMQKPK